MQVKERCNMIEHRLVKDHLFGTLDTEECDRHTPASLSGDTPVGSALDHRLKSVLRRSGVEVDIFDSIECRLSESLLGTLRGIVDRDEPLVGRSVDQRFLRSPAVWIGVDERTDLQEAFPQKLEDLLIDFEDMHPDKFFRIWQQAQPYDRLIVKPLLIDRHHHFQPILEPYFVVIFTMSGRGMDTPCTAIHQNVVSEYHFGGSAV